MAEHTSAPVRPEGEMPPPEGTARSANGAPVRQDPRPDHEQRSARTEGDSGSVQPQPRVLTPDERRRGRRTLLLLATVALAPVVVSTVIYFFFPRTAQTNYGRLIAGASVPNVTGTALDGAVFDLASLRGHWVLLTVAPGRCDAACVSELYATRQARTIQGREQDRVVRVWLVTDETSPPPPLIAEHPGLRVARVTSPVTLPMGEAGIYLLDPLGNPVLHYPEDPDIKALAKDLGRVLRASSIG